MCYNFTLEVEMKDEIKFEAQLSPFRDCISMNADGGATIKFTTDGTQLSKVIQALATFPKGKLIEVSLKSGIDKELKKYARQSKPAKIIR